MEKNNRLLETYEQIKSILMANEFSVSGYRLIEYGLQFNVGVIQMLAKFEKEEVT